MHIEVRARELGDPGGATSYARERLQLAFDRFAGEVDEVFVRIESVNGARGRGQRCVIAFWSLHVGGFLVEETTDDVLAAIDVAAERAGRTMSKALDRARTSRPRIRIHTLTASDEEEARKAG
jgi:hypothetical protein